MEYRHYLIVLLVVHYTATTNVASAETLKEDKNLLPVPKPSLQSITDAPNLPWLIFLPGFNVGHQDLSMFPYDSNDGYMSPEEASQWCEEDLQCGGFTYRGPIIEEPERGLAKFWISFCHFVPSQGPASTSRAAWTTYKVKSRNFVVLPGQRPQFGQREESGLDILQFKAKVEQGQWIEDDGLLAWPRPNITTLSFNSLQPAHVLVREGLEWTDLIRDPPESASTWTTVMHLHGPDRFYQSAVHQPLEQYCPIETQVDGYISNYLHTDANIDSVPCDISPEDFLENYVRQSRAVKLIGCKFKTEAKESKDLLKRIKGGLSQKVILKLLKKEGSATNFKVRYSSNELKWNAPIGPVSLSAVNKVLLKRFPYEIILPLAANASWSQLIRDQDWMPQELYAPSDPTADSQRPPRVIFQSPNTGLPLGITFEDQVKFIVSGEQRWVFFPPEAMEWASSSKCANSKLANVWSAATWFNHLFSQIIRDTRFRSRGQMAILRPGEALYIPSQVVRVMYNQAESVTIHKDLHLTLNGLLGGNYQLLASPTTTTEVEQALSKALNRLELVASSPAQERHPDAAVAQAVREQVGTFQG